MQTGKKERKKEKKLCQLAAQHVSLTVLFLNCHLGQTTATVLQVTHFSSRWRKNICFLAHKLSAGQTIPQAHLYLRRYARPPLFCPSCRPTAHFIMSLLVLERLQHEQLSLACEFTSLLALGERIKRGAARFCAIRQAALFQLSAIFSHNYQ